MVVDAVVLSSVVDLDVKVVGVISKVVAEADPSSRLPNMPKTEIRYPKNVGFQQQ